MNTVVLLLGSNVGERVMNLERACLEIEKQLGKIAQVSSVYETAAWGNEDQQSFLNQVVIISSGVDAEEMIHRIIAMEEKMGRLRTTKWEPRIIDIDILFFNDEIISEDMLTVPHPGLHERKFTLVPLVELIPSYIHPVLKKSMLQLLNETSDSLDVKKINTHPV